MSDPIDDSDPDTIDEAIAAELLERLAAALAGTEPVPETVLAGARAAFTWRTIDAELAELLHDSALDAGAAVRSAGAADGPRTLSFRRAAVTLEVEIDGDAVLGEVIDDGPADAPAVVTLQRPEADDRTTECDPSGFFRFDDVAPGPVRFVVGRSGWTLTTPWATI